MKWPNGTKTLFKTISALMAGIFLWQQVAWAGDLIDTTLNKQYEEQSQTFAPAYIKSQQANNEALVTQKQAIEDAANTQGITTQPASASTQTTTDDSLTLQGPKGGSAKKSSSAISAATIQSLTSQGNSSVLSVTTSVGDVIYYKDGAIDYISKKDGTVLRNIVVDTNNNLLGADITYIDGTVQTVSGGKTIKIIKSDGTIYNYNSEELIESVVYPDSTTCYYSYIKDGQENIIETILTDTEKVCHYNNDNKLTKVVFNDGKTIEYDNGIITKATDEDGIVYTYDTTENTQGSVTEYLAKLKTMVDSSGVKYDITDSNITGVELPDKTITDFGLDGSGKVVNGNIEYSDGTKVSVESKRITEITETSGITTAYQYSTDGLDCDVTINDHGAIKNYTYSKDLATGNFTIEDGAREYEYNALWKLEKFTDDIGSFQHTYSTGGAYSGSIFTTQDGTIREYDATQRLIKTTFSDGTTTYYIYSGESIQQAINTAKSGDTIYVHPGTYHEHIALSSGVNLIGDNKSTTIINGDYQAGSNVIVASGNNRIENITISGGGPYSGYPASAIRIEGDNVSIRNNTIVDNQDYAVYVWSGSNILVEKNFFKNNHLGVQLPNSGTTIQYNTFVNNDIAINVLNGPAPIIRNNIITGSSFQSIYEFSWAAYSTGQPASGYAIVEGNILYNNAEHGGAYCKCLPPAVISQTSGNLITNPLFTNPSAGDYSIPGSSPAFGKGSLLPQTLSDSLDNASGLNITTTLAILNTFLQIPTYVFQTDAPKIFPDGKTDILNNTIPDIGFSIELPDKNTPYFDTITYDQNKIIKQILKANGDTITYKDGLVDTILSSSSSTSYSYTLSGLNNISGITIDRDGIKRIYDSYGNLQSISLSDATQIVYENGQIKEIDKADGTKIKNMTFTDTGELDSALISYPDGSVAVYEDAQLLQIINQSGDAIDYSDGEIRHITLADGTVYDWSYVSGNIIILDNSQQENRTYCEGKLIQVEELTGTKLITKYYYDNTSGNLIKTEVCQNGEVLYTYTYTYETGLTLIHDQDGNTQAYTQDKKLSYIIDSTGKKYSYTYVGKNEAGTEIYFPSGVKVNYDSSGNMIGITESDGTIIKDIVFNGSNTPQSFTYIKDGSTYKVVGGNLSEVIDSNGTDTLYYDNGFIKSIQAQIVSDLESYQYYVNDAKIYEDVSALQSGSVNNLSYYVDNNNTAYLGLSNNSLEFGNGINGIKHVTANETLPVGAYNFASLIIDTGKTLTVASGTTIKCLGTVDIKGTLSGSNLDINAYMITIGTSGSITGLGQHLKAYTINNSGNMETLIASGIPNSYTGGGSGSCVSGGGSFPQECKITKLVYNVFAEGNTDDYSCAPHCYAECDVDIYQNGQWLTVYNNSQSVNGHPATATLNSTSTGSWDNCTAIRARALSTASADHDVAVDGHVSNIQAFTTPTCEYISSSGNVPASTNNGQFIYPISGTFQSGVIEVDALQLNNILWSENLPLGTNITFQTRTGNIITPDATWTDWSAPITNNAGSQITSAPGKYMQYKINMSTSNTAITPTVKIDYNNVIQLGYDRVPQGISESLDYFTKKINDTTFAYNSSGQLIWKDTGGIKTYYNPPDVSNAINLENLMVDNSKFNDIANGISQYILNDTQKAVYLKDSVIISELTAINNNDGTVIEYCQGQISKITLPDGTVITNITFDANNNVQNFTYVKNSITYVVKNGIISEEITPAGNDIKYYSFGAISSIENGGSIKDYVYNIATNLSYKDQIMFQNGSLNNLSYSSNGSNTYLELTRPLLDLGDGRDGALNVATGQTIYIDGSKQYSSINIEAGAVVTVAPWNGTTGGDIEIRCNGNVVINGTIDASATGYRGGVGILQLGAPAWQGESYIGISSQSVANNYGGGGGGEVGYMNHAFFICGSGGSYGTEGTVGSVWTQGWPDTPIPYAGDVYGDQYLSQLYRGSGGGGAIQGSVGGNGGGIIKIVAPKINISGSLSANGGTGGLYGGGGSGGSILLVGDTILISGSISANGGQGGSVSGYPGGNGGYGRIRIDYTNLTGNIPPQAYTQQLNYVSLGTFDSKVIELNANQLGKISWNETLPTGTQITLQTRTGNSSTPDPTWSDWSQTLTDSNGSQITSPVGKYIQYRVTLSTQNNIATPNLVLTGTQGLTINYLINPLSKDDLNNVTTINVTENGTTSTYDKNGVNITNPLDTIDVSSLIFDSTYLNTLKSDIPTYKLGDAQKVVTIYDQGNNIPVETVSADQSITYFENGYATKVLDKNGVLQVQYTYDANYNITNVELVDARQKLEENYQEALANIITEKEAELARIAALEVSSKADIDSKAASIQQQINDERQKLTLEEAQYDPSRYDLSEFTQAFAKLDDYQAQLLQQKQDAYTDLASQIATATARINADASTAMQDLINNDYNKILADIVQKESSPIIYQYYRKVLGRDPSDDDLLYWMNKAKTDLTPVSPTIITQYIQSLPEYADRQTRKQNIISELTTFFTQYVSASDTAKETMLSSLGLTPADVISISQDDANSIVSYLNSQSLHFGDSAINTVVTMLKNAGITKTFEDVGKDAIKIDILTGVITKATTGDLLISLYAMRKVAAINGLSLYSEKITYDDLKDQVSRGNVIIHIDGKHYVLVTSIDDTKGTVTYTDTTVGQNGQSITISRAELMNIWKGYSLAKESPNNPAKQINVTQEKNIRGSSWWSSFWKAIVNFFQKIIAPIATILLFIPPLAPLAAVALGINIIVQTISFVVHTGTLMDVVWSVVNAIGAAIGSMVLPNIYDAIGPIFNQIGSAISATLNGVFSSVMPIFNTITSAVQNIATGIGSIFNITIQNSLISSITTKVITAGIQLGSDYVFKSLHIDPTLSQIGSSLFASAVMGALTGNVNIITQALESGVIAGVEELGKATGLDPNITELAAMMSGSLVGGALDIDGHHLTYEQLMEGIAIKMSSEAAYIGITDVGELLGIDPRISSLIGIGIRSSLLDGLMIDPVTGEWKYDVNRLWTGVETGLLQGVTNIGLSYATQELGLNPLLANLGFSAISSAINAGIQVATGKSDNFFDSIFKTYTDNALTFSGYGNAPNRGDQQFWIQNGTQWDFNEVAYNQAWANYNLQQSVYIAQIQDFTNIVKDRGIVEALNTYGAGFFNAVAVNQIVQSGLTIGDYFKNKLDLGQGTTRILQDGQQVTQVAVKDAQGNVISNVFFVQKQNGASLYWDIVGAEDLNPDGSYLGWGSLGVDTYGKLGYTNAQLYSIFNSDTQFQRIQDGQQTYVEIKDSQGNTLLVIEPTSTGGYNIYNSKDEYENAKINIFSDGYNVILKDGLISFPDTEYIKFDSLSEGERNALKIKFDLTDQQLDTLLDRIRTNIGSGSNVEPGFGTSLAFADEVMNYQENKIEEMANSIKNNNPTLWDKVGNFFKSIGSAIDYQIDYVKSNYNIFGQSDPAIISNVYNKIISQNINFFDGYHYNPGETSLQIDPNQQIIENAFGQNYWWNEESIVIVRYQDKFAAFGEKFFDTLLKEKDSVDLTSPDFIDKIDSRFNDPNGNQKVQSFISAVDLINSWSAGTQVFTGGDGVYHIEIQRQLNLGTGGNTRHWWGYINSYDTNGNPQRVPIQDKQFLLDLINNSRS